MAVFPRLLPAALAATLAFGAGAAQAALIFEETITPVSGNGDTTFFAADNDFDESFDFTALDIVSIDRFELTLESSEFGQFPFELWSVRAQGSDPSVATDDAFDLINSATQTFVYDVSSPGDVFAHSSATQVFTFWLSEFVSGLLPVNPSITISSATLRVYGEVSPIPVPAALPLLALGLAGFGAYRHRQRRKTG